MKKVSNALVISGGGVKLQSIMRQYTILNVVDLHKLDFTEFLSDSIDSITYNIAKTLAIVSFEDSPSGDSSEMVINIDGIIQEPVVIVRNPTSLAGIIPVQYETRDFHNHEQRLILKQLAVVGSTIEWVNTQQ